MRSRSSVRLPRRALRSPLATPITRTVRSRIETGRLVLYSLLAGVVVGALGILLRLLLNQVVKWGGLLSGYSPPGTPGEGGLLMAFGDALPYGLLALPVAAVLAAWLTQGRSDPLSEIVSAYHRRGGTRLSTQLRLLAASLLGTGWACRWAETRVSRRWAGSRRGCWPALAASAWPKTAA